MKAFCQRKETYQSLQRERDILKDQRTEKLNIEGEYVKFSCRAEEQGKLRIPKEVRNEKSNEEMNLQQETDSIG